MKAYFFRDGIKKLAREISGKENIFLGIRPYGFHAGNMMSLVLFPALLCQELKTLGTEPRFNIFLFINDWEQDGLTGPNTEVYPFNVIPKNSTLQYMNDPVNKDVNIVDYWHPVITKNVNEVQKLFPKVKVKSVRSSGLKNNPIMKKHLLFTIQNPSVLAEILKIHTNKKVLNDPVCYAMAVCPKCQKTKGRTRVNKKHVIHTCFNCRSKTKGKYSDFDYWFYHKAFAIPRLEIFDIDIVIFGLDHFKEGDLIVRQELIKKYGSKAKFPKVLYTQEILGRNGDKMGKSRGNTEIIKLDDLIRLFNKYPNKKSIQIGT